MNTSLHRLAPALFVGAALLATACTDRLPVESAGPAAPGAPRMTVIPTVAFSLIEAGATHSCALTSGGQAYCWGRNPMGQLGDTTFTNQNAPVAVIQPAGVTFTDISAGATHTCAVSGTGQAYCWGNNGDGRLGDSTTTPRNAPVAVLPLGGVSLVSVSAGNAHTCGLTSGGAAYCWGNNQYGQIGDSTTVFAGSPVAVRMPTGVTFSEIHAAERHTCALDGSTGQAYCWGYGGDGAIGNNSLIGPRIPTAVQQPGGVTFTSIATESFHSCGVTSGGQGYCWGRNDWSQLGDSTTTNRKTPVAVVQPSGVAFASMTANGTVTCGVTSAGQEYCWGLNNRGQLGIGSTTSTRVPTAVSQPAGVAFGQISAGSVFGCGLDGVGQTWCWGRNDWGQVGDGSNTDRNAPVAVAH